jgi:GrpB-like predicted nucleotidyltransferase (UPF0157 family)
MIERLTDDIQLWSLRPGETPFGVHDMIGLKRGTVALKKHRAEWAAAFEEEKANLEKLSSDVALDIQHVGSTSIAGLSAKPIIDIAMAVSSLSDISKIRTTLERAGYEYRENGSDEIRVLFAKGPEVKRTHYLHITALGSSEWQSFLAFRDYLRTHPDETERYEQLKQKLAAQHPDNRAMYTAGKRNYIEGVVGKARDER